MDRQPCVYILARASHSTLYTGVTSDLLARTYQHREGLADGFTKRYGIKGEGGSRLKAGMTRGC